MDWLVGEHRHLSRRAVRALDRSQALPDALVDVSMVKFMYPVIGEKILQSVFQKLLVLGIAQGPSYQYWSAIPDVGRDNFVRQLGTAKMPQHGVDRVHQIEPRVNQSAIQVKDQQLDRTRIELAVEFDHFPSASRINEDGPQQL